LFGVCRVDGLVKRVEDVLSVLELIVGDLKDLAEGLKRLVDEWKWQCEVSVESVRGMTSEGLHAYPSSRGDLEHVIVNVQRRLNAEQFKAVANVVIGRLGGEYVSAGDKGCFRIQKKGAWAEPLEGSF
jgi:hypothetical protein